MLDFMSTAIRYQRGLKVLAGVNFTKNNLSVLARSEEWKGFVVCEVVDWVVIGGGKT